MVEGGPLAAARRGCPLRWPNGTLGDRGSGVSGSPLKHNDPVKKQAVCSRAAGIQAFPCDVTIVVYAYEMLADISIYHSLKLLV